MANTNFCGCGNDYPIVPGTNPALQTWNGQAFVVADGSAQNPIRLPFLKVNGGAATYVVGADNNGNWSYYSPNLSPNLSGGSAGQVPWQISTNVTGFTATGTNGQLLQSGGTGSPGWVNQSSINAGSISGGLAGQLLIQSAPSNTSFIYPNDVNVTATGSTTARTLANRFSDTQNVKNFGAIGNGITDDTIAIQNAINSFTSNGGVLSFPVGNYKISSTLTVLKPVMLVGQGSGDISGIAGLPATQITWAGNASPMINYGGFGTLFSGGGIQYLALNGSSIATQCLVTKDLTRATFTSIVLSNAVTSAWLITNTIGQFPTGFFNCNDIRIFLRGGSTQNASGIAIQGISSINTDGVTLCQMNDVRIEHANGSGVLIGTNNPANRDAGDGFVWQALYTFRASTETGFGVWFSQINSNSICSGHSFYSPVVNGGYFFQTAGLNYGTKIYQANETDLASNVSVLTYGAGVIDISCEGQAGTYYGRGVIPNTNSSQIQDAMCFLKYDSVNAIVNTMNGAWSAITTNGANYTDGGSLGSSVIMITGATSGNAAALYGPPSFKGVANNLTPMLSCLFYAIETVNTQIKIGFFDSVGTTISNGVYVQYDSSINANWQLVCVNNGIATTQTLSFGPSQQAFEWKIRYDFSFASFNFRGQDYVTVLNAGTISTNIPSTLLGFGALVRTKSANITRLAIDSIKLGFVDEGYPLD
jgi:hypothetical protein